MWAAVSTSPVHLYTCTPVCVCVCVCVCVQHHVGQEGPPAGRFPADPSGGGPEPAEPQPLQISESPLHHQDRILQRGPQEHQGAGTPEETSEADHYLIFSVKPNNDPNPTSSSRRTRLPKTLFANHVETTSISRVKFWPVPQKHLRSLFVVFWSLLKERNSPYRPPPPPQYRSCGFCVRMNFSNLTFQKQEWFSRLWITKMLLCW